MSKTLRIENETHWRSSDILRIVRMAMEEGGADPSEPRVVRVLYTRPLPKRNKKSKSKPKRRKRHEAETSTPSEGHARFFSSIMLEFAGNSPHKVQHGEFKGEQVTTEIAIYLPKRGARDPHPVAMVAIAASAAVANEVDEEATLLPFSDVYFLANYLALNFAEETMRGYEDEPGKETNNDRFFRLKEFYRSTTPPEWGDASKLYVVKYKDPLKDATYISFVRRKETAIKREETNIENLEAEISKLKKRLSKAKKRKKEAERSLKSARERRT